jgi:hypothetical protein
MSLPRTTADLELADGGHVGQQDRDAPRGDHDAEQGNSTTNSEADAHSDVSLSRIKGDWF